MKFGQDKHSQRTFTPRVFFTVLIFVALASAAVGLKLGGNESLSFYGRYDGAMPTNVVPVIRDVIIHALPDLVLIMAMLLSSFSPFLIPLCITASVLRGFICGAAVGIAGLSAEAVVFAASTFAVCLLAALLRHFSSNTGDRAYIPKRIYTTLCTAGFCVLCEVLLLIIS